MHKKIKIIQDFLPNAYFQEINNILDNTDFGWFFQKNTVTGTKPIEESSFWGFRHLFFANNEVNSSFGPYILPITYHVADALDKKIEKVLNIHANFVLKKNQVLSEKRWHELSAHNDGLLELENQYYERWTALLYMNDADGDTVFFEKNESGELVEILRQKPVANTVVIFPSAILHSPGLPYESFMRRVINMNILVRKEK